jgi:O-antigen/teichoic acid export membrane protein
MKTLLIKLLHTVQQHTRIDVAYYSKGAFWLTVIQVITVLGSLITSVMMAHMLSEADYGTYRYILGIGALVSAFSLTGMGQSIFQTSALGYHWFYTIGIRQSNVYGICVTVLSLFLSVYYLYQDNIELGIGCLLIALLQPVLNTYQQIFPFLQGAKKFRQSALLQGIKTTVITLTSLGALLITHNILWLIAVYFISNISINYVVHVWHSPTATNSFDQQAYSRYVAYAKNTSIRNIISIIAFRIDSVIVFQQLGASQLAIYTIANIIPEHIKASFKNMSTLLVPKYARHENLLLIQKSLKKRSQQLFFVTVSAMIVYIVLSSHLYKILFPKYHEAVILSQIVALSFPAMTALIPLSALQAHTKESELSKLNTSSSLLTIVITTLFTIFFGLVGAVAARVLSRYITLLLTYYYFLKS